MQAPSLREPLRLISIGVCTIAAVIAADTWPNFAYAIWAVFLIAMAGHLYVDVPRPVNYESMHISAGVVEYVAVGQKHVIRLEEVSKLEFVREEALFPDMDGPYIESKWVVESGGQSIEVMDERPHRNELVQAFRQHLPQFDEQSARAGLKARGEGRWVCYEASGRGVDEA